MNDRTRAKFGICAVALVLGTALFTVQIEGERQRLLMKGHDASKPIHYRFPFPEEFRGMVTSWIYIEADRYFHQEKWDRIVPLFRARATLDPALTDSWSTGAWHLAFNLSEEAKSPDEKMKFIQQGVRFLEEGIRKNPDVAHLYFDLAWTYYMRLGDFNKATQNFKTAFTIKPDLATAIWLTYLYEKQGRFEDAMRVWEKYIAHFPNDPRALDRFGKAYARARRNQKININELVAGERKTLLSKG